MDFFYALKKEMLRRNYSIRTVQTYTFCLKRFLRFYKDKDIKKISKKDVKDYLNYLAAKKASGSTLNIHLNALKFFIENILNKNFMVRIKYSKTPKILPIVLNKEEVVRLINLSKKHTSTFMLRFKPFLVLS